MAIRNRPFQSNTVSKATKDNAVYKEKPKYSQKGRPVAKKTAVLVVLLGVTLLLLRRTHNHEGPPSTLHTSSRRDYFHKVPEEYRRHFFIDNDNKFRRTMIRAFRNRGWKKANDSQEAHFIWDKAAWGKRYNKLQPWQRYNHIPNYKTWENKDNFISGFQEYYHKHPNEVQFVPETFRLNSEGREAFRARLYSQGGMDEPWVLKIPNENNGRGITMLGPNSKELKGVLDEVIAEEDDKSDYVIQSYVCNELTWYENHKFDLRFYWMVASLDPLILLYHDGYVRVGNSAYDESDWSSTRQHLTTHTFLADEVKGTMEEFKTRLRQHYYENKASLSHVHTDPVTHVRNQFKAAIAQTAAAFQHVTFGNDERHLLTSENGYGFYGCDFILDNDLNAYYVEAQMGPGMEEEFDFRVDMHADLLRSMVDIVEEIQLKQEKDASMNLLPIKSLGNWEVVYAGDWQYRYEGYERPKKAKCGHIQGAVHQLGVRKRE